MDLSSIRNTSETKVWEDQEGKEKTCIFKVAIGEAITAVEG